MKVVRFVKLLLVGALFLSSMNVMASEVENSQEQSTVVENSVDKTSLPGSAQDWDLSESEWMQYQKLMQGPAGLWYRQLSPPAVLGMNADNSEDKKHFAEVYARQEHQKVERELAFNKAAFEAMQRLYKGEPMIQPFDITPFSPFLLAGK